MPDDAADRCGVDVGAVQGFYGRWAWVYDQVARRTPGIGGLRARAVDLLGVGAGDVVVDMGCGTGANLPYLRERVGPDGVVVGVDVTPGAVARANARVRRAGWENVHVVVGDARRPPVVGGVDGVVASFVMGMLPDPAETVARWCGLLGTGGRVCLMDFTRSRRAYAPVVNAALHALVLVSAPRREFEEPPTRLLERRVGAAHDALTARAPNATTEDAAFGAITLTAGTPTTRGPDV